MSRSRGWGTWRRRWQQRAAEALSGAGAGGSERRAAEALSRAAGRSRRGSAGPQDPPARRPLHGPGGGGHGASSAGRGLSSSPRWRPSEPRGAGCSSSRNPAGWAKATSWEPVGRGKVAVGSRTAVGSAGEAAVTGGAGGTAKRSGGGSTEVTGTGTSCGSGPAPAGWTAAGYEVVGGLAGAAGIGATVGSAGPDPLAGGEPGRQWRGSGGAQRSAGRRAAGAGGAAGAPRPGGAPEAAPGGVVAPRSGAGFANRWGMTPAARWAASPRRVGAPTTGIGKSGRSAGTARSARHRPHRSAPSGAIVPQRGQVMTALRYPARPGTAARPRRRGRGAVSHGRAGRATSGR